MLPKFNPKQALKLALLGASSLLFFAPSLAAIEAIKTSNNSQQTVSQISGSDRSFTIAQANCPSRRSQVDRTFETTNYYIYICSGDGRNSLGYYIGAAKDGSGGITVPLTRRSGDRYIAANGNTLYAVTPYELRVTQNGRIILNERILTAGGDSSQVRGCRNRESTFVTAETANFIVSICGGDFPGTYVGESKNGTGRIRLPLQRYQRDRFIATNGDTRYTLTSNELRVIQGGRTIVREPILSWN